MEAQVPENEKFTMPTGIYLLHKSKEVMTMIMAHLNVKDTCSAAQVCKEWRSAANHPRVWKKSEITICLLTPASPHLIKMMAWRRLYKLIVNKLNGANHLRDIVHGIPSLRRLHICGSPDATDQMLVDALPAIKATLTELRLEHCPGISDITVQHLTIQQIHLARLYLNACNGLTDESLRLISKSMFKLQLLDLCHCDGITDSGIESLRLKNYRSRKLVYLQLNGCKQLSGKVFQHLKHFETQVESLSYGPTSKLTAATTMMHLANSIQLVALVLVGNFIDDTCLYMLVSDRSRLSILVLHHCTRVTDLGLRYVATLPSLTTLSVIFCSGVKDDGLRHLTNAGSKLISLRLKACYGITDEGMKHVANMPRLRKLELNLCEKITSMGFNNLAEWQSNLESIIVEKCENVGQSAFRVIASGLFKVRYLDLQEGQLSEQGMILAARTLPNLQSVLAGGNEFVGDIRHLRRTGPQS